MNTVKGGGRVFLFLALAIFWLGMCACSSKETVLLETEDLVEASYETKPDKEEPETPADEEDKQVEESTLFIHICGAVKEPGVYELLKGGRIFDAVQAAGGFALDADESYVNMAMVLEDGWKVVIPSIEDTHVMSTDNGFNNGIEIGVTAGAGNETVISGRPEKDGPLPVNINTADKEELCTLPGIGESRADRIVLYREKHGEFTKPEDIMQIEGIKEGMFLKLKDRICVE